MKIISLVNSKGGAGKSTLCINLAVEMQKHLYANKQISESSNELLSKDAKVLIIDADPQGTARDWHDEGGYKFIDLIVIDRKQTLINLPNLELDYDFVFIDTPGRISEITTSALIISDLVLVPIQPSPSDIWATSDTVEVIKQRQTITCGAQPIGKFILNRCIPNTLICKDAKEYLNKSAFPHILEPVYQRVAYAESLAKGQSIFESGNEQAMVSISKIGNEIREILKNVIG
jgi:chromosome partitioning protein